MNGSSLFDRLGGSPGITALVDDVVSAHMRNPVISARFRPYLDTPERMTVLKGHLCAFLAALQALSPLLLGPLDAMIDPSEDPTRAARAAFNAGAGLGAIVNALFGIVLIVIGVAIWRRIAWGHTALTLACWASIAVLAILAKPTLAPFFALAGGEAGAGEGTGIIVTALVLLVAQVIAVLWFLRFWRRPDVRAAFR